VVTVCWGNPVGSISLSQGKALLHSAKKVQKSSQLIIIGIREDTFHPLYFLDQILSAVFIKKIKTSMYQIVQSQKIEKKIQK
jgi:hypothetical protein